MANLEELPSPPGTTAAGYPLQMLSACDMVRAVDLVTHPCIGAIAQRVGRAQSRNVP